MKPLVSVVIPVYNAEDTIIACVKSVLEQTYKHIEIIVIDDGSTDTTRGLLEEYQKQVCINNLQIISQENAGPSKARNLGIKLAKGEYIAFLDADDTWLPMKLEKQMLCFVSNEIGLVGCRFCIGNVKIANEHSNVVHISLKKLIFKNYFTTPSVIVSSKVFKNYQFNPFQKYSEDYCLWLQIASEYKCVLLTETLVQLYNKPNFGSIGLSGNLWGMEKGELSNFRLLLVEGKISFFFFIACSIYSWMKYFRRYIITKTLHLKNRRNVFLETLS